MTTIRIRLPHHLRTLTGSGDEVSVEVPGAAPTYADALDALERDHPVLRGTIREQGTARRRAYIRYFACGRDLSHAPADEPVPAAVVAGEEPLIVMGAIAGG